MFRATKLRLITLNAAVFFTLLLLIAGGSYLYVKQQLLAKADAALPFGKPAFAGASAALPADNTEIITGDPLWARAVVFRIDKTDRTVYSVLWDAEERPLSKLLPEELDAALLKKLKTGLDRTEPFSVRSGGRTFRVLSVPQTVLTSRAGGALLEIRTVQYLTNITEDMNLIRNLLALLLAGIAGAGILALAAGWYLASRALVPIRDAWERQQRFVADASHELRTPLAVIQAHTELLLRHPDRRIVDESRSVSTLLKEGRRMRKLVDGLLTLARADAGGAALAVKTLRLDLAVRTASEQMEELAACKNIVMRLEPAPEIECPADEDRLHQLLLIVLDNAIKYTPEGGIVNVSCTRLQSTARITVEDTGVGIPAQDLPHIFERFYRSDKVRSRENGGIGLGLAIARWIAESHGGDIRAESRFGAGSTFIIQLPL